MVRKPAVLGWLPTLVCTLLLPASAAAQLDAVSPQLSFGDDADVGIGVRFSFGTPQWSPDSEIQLGFDLFFPDEPRGVDIGYWEINGNWVKHFRLGGNSTLLPYAGAGLNLAHLSWDDDDNLLGDRSDTDLGVNLLGGLRFNLAQFDPFVEVRFELAGGEQGVLTGGLRIPS